MSQHAAWSELVTLWKTAEGAPDLRDFWARHVELSLAEQMRLLAWHGDCQRALADQLGLPSNVTAELPLAFPSAQERPEGGAVVEGAAGSESLAARLEKLPPLPDLDQPAEQWLAHERLSDLPGALNGGRVGSETPRSLTSDSESLDGRGVPFAAGVTGSITVDGSAVILGDRYRLDRLLGEGNYGRVWLGFDRELRRQVAIKVPLPGRFQTAADAELYRSEARTVASLPHHAHLVPVHDVGRMPDGAIYVVSGYVNGRTLQAELKQGLPTLDRAVAILRAIADALLHAHAAGLIHRDVKPANILIDAATKAPYLADFGLAVREDDSLAAAPAGSPAYMSPEQAVSNGQTLDGRSDLFSLGIIAYEMFTGKLPFRGRRISDVIQAIVLRDPAPPREVRPDLPPELERICLRLLQKRTSDRYGNAAELMVDLEAWSNRGQRLSGAVIDPPVEAVVTPPGLRAFTGDDSQIFLDLLPGQLDRDGLPDSVAFWKHRLDSTSETFRVGLVLGPSGSGKSSLVRAGVLPRLNHQICRVYLQATPDRTEEELVRELRAQISALPPNLSVVEALCWVRKRAGKEGPVKTVLVLDQFEQWLNSHPISPSVDLVRALGHCDGRRLQTLLLVRDDFGVATNRLLRRLDIPLVENHNWRTSDLFDVEHAQRVLVKLGRGYGALPRPPAELSAAQQAFCQQASELLAEHGQVVPVRLALFADLMKRKRWEPETLAELGGTAGIGAAFLEETLGDGSGNPRYREVSEWAQRVLRGLLPLPGTNIKGHQRTLSELAELAQGPADSWQLNETLAILDGDLRLITATETGRDRNGGAAQYQLAHDYLVPALREWLERKQRETPKGRAELLLAERSALWSVKREDRHLPTWNEHLRIRRLTDSGRRSEPERALLTRAAVVHGRNVAMLLTVLLAVAAGTWGWSRSRAQERLAREQERFALDIAATVEQLETAQPADWERVLTPLREPRAAEVANEQLARIFEAATAGGRAPQTAERLARLTLAGDQSQLDPLRERLLAGPLAEFLPTRQLLAAYKQTLVGPLWSELRDVQNPPSRRLRAGMVLAGLAPGEKFTQSDSGTPLPESWMAGDAKLVAEQLLASNPEFHGELRKALRPIAPLLLDEIERQLVDESADKGQRNAAATAVVDYAGTDTERLARLLTRATPEQFHILYPAFESGLTVESRARLATLAALVLSPDKRPVTRITLGRERANAAATLLRLGEWAAALKVCDMADDSEALTQFLFACRPRGVPVGTLLACLDEVTTAPAGKYTPQVRYALLVALGEYPFSEVPAAERDARLEQVVEWYRNDASSTVHGAAGWLLRQWGAKERAAEIERLEVKYVPGREWYTEVVEIQPQPGEGAGQLPGKQIAMTFIVIPPGEYEIGSVEEASEQSSDEAPHTVKLTRPFALLDREVTFEEYLAFAPGHLPVFQRLNGQPGTAAAAVVWYEAVGYCRWLGQQTGLPELNQSYGAPNSAELQGLEREPDARFQASPREWPVELGRRGYRLPTEAEWEVASRSLAVVGGRGLAGRSVYGFGSDVRLLDRFAWFEGNSGEQLHEGRGRIPSLRGLWDMHGGVAEWVHDWGEAYPSSGPEIDPTGPQTASDRVFRGGPGGTAPTVAIPQVGAAAYRFSETTTSAFAWPAVFRSSRREVTPGQETTAPKHQGRYTPKELTPNRSFPLGGRSPQGG